MKQSNKLHHISIIMDGNGRWAKQRFMPRIAGHRAGAKSVHRAIDYCVKNHITVLSLFALSVENFQSRSESEVSFLISLLSEMLLQNLDEMHQNHIRIQVIGDWSVFQPTVQAHIQHAQTLTENNTGLTLVLAVNYSGRWDIVQAAKQFAHYVATYHLDLEKTTEKDFSQFLCLHALPEPDLLIRTSGEQRISNFMLWQFAYTELCFVDAFWPDFNEAIFSEAIDAYLKRDRRFGTVG